MGSCKTWNDNLTDAAGAIGTSPLYDFYFEIV